MKRRRLRKTEHIKEDKIREKLIKANAHWNYWKLQLHWDNLEWLDQNNKHKEESILFLNSQVIH